MNLLDNFAPLGAMRFNLISCSDCGTKHISTEGTDNAYRCGNRKCRKDLMVENQTIYDVLESELIEFLQKNYKGKSIGSRNEP